MKYMEIIQKSLSNAWRFKFLWLFGFFVSLGDSNMTGMMNWKDFKGQNFMDRFEELSHLNIEIDPMLIFYALVAIFIIWFIFWVLSILSEGALIQGIAKKEFGKTTGFADCWSAGINKFFRLFGIMLIALLASVLLIFSSLIFIIPSFALAAGLGLVITLLLIPIFILIIFIIVTVMGWAIRYAVLYDTKWIDSISKGWQLFKENLGPSIGIAFSSFFTQFILGLGIILSMLVLSIPFIFIGMANLWLGIITGVLFGLSILFITSCYMGILASSIWTLGFIQMTGYVPAETTAATPPPPKSENYDI